MRCDLDTTSLKTLDAAPDEAYREPTAWKAPTLPHMLPGEWLSRRRKPAAVSIST